MDAEAGVRRDLAELTADVAGADDVEVGRWRQRLDVHVHLSATDQAVLLREVVVELVVEERRAPRDERVARLPERIVLVAPAADGADGAAVGEHQHLRAGTLWRRAVGADDGHERDGLAALQRCCRGGEDFFAQTRTSIFARFLASSMKLSTRCCFFWLVKYSSTCGLTSSNGTVDPTFFSVSLMM